jgi:hypothetical protein
MYSLFFFSIIGSGFVDSAIVTALFFSCLEEKGVYQIASGYNGNGICANRLNH